MASYSSGEIAPRSRRSARLASVLVTSSGLAFDDVAPDDGETPVVSPEGGAGRVGAGGGAVEGADNGPGPLPVDVPAVAGAPGDDPVATGLV